MATKKRAIESRQGHARGIDDIIKVGENIVEGIIKKQAPKVKKAVSKAKNDIPDPKYKKNPYNKKGGMTKNYKDYVMKQMKGDY